MLSLAISLAVRVWLATHSYVVQEVDGPVARIELCDGMVDVPTDLLPPCAVEGAWVSDSACTTAFNPATGP